MGRRKNGTKSKKYADGQHRRYGADPAENKTQHIRLKLNSNEIKWTPGHIYSLLCSVSCVCMGETKLAAYKILTSTLRKHVEVR